MKNEKQCLNENKMGVMPVNKLLITMSAPIILSMFVLSLYNIVDSIFVAMINEDALTAVTLAFPLQNLMISVAVGTCVGVNALLSKSLGEKDYKRVNKIANNGIFLAIISSLVFLIIGLFLSKMYISLQTDSKQIIEYGTSYVSIVCMFSFTIFVQNVFEKILTSTGKTIYTMITQATGAVINIILDPILIFGLFGFPQMGVQGAAIATVIGQGVAAILAFLFNRKFNHEVKISRKVFRPEWKIIKNIYAIGIPSIIMLSIGTILTFSMNKILIMFSSTATAVFGIYFRLQGIVFMPVFGLNNGMVPIIAYNYGAKQKDRIIKTIKLSIIYAVSIMFIGLIIIQLFPDELLHLFSASDKMVEIGVPALKIISLCWILAGVSVILSTVFQALGKAFFSMIISIARQLVILLPIAYLLAQTGEVKNVWYAFPIAELVAFIMCCIFFKHTYNKVIKNIL